MLGVLATLPTSSWTGEMLYTCVGGGSPGLPGVLAELGPQDVHTLPTYVTYITF